MDPADVESALSYLDPTDRDVWIRMGMAVKVEMGEAGFDIWDAWSQSAGSYNARAARSSWRSFKDSGRIGIGSLIFAAKDAGWQPASVAKELTEAEKAARRQRIEQAERDRLAEQERVAEKAGRIWNNLRESGASTYLARKNVRAWGVRFSRGSIVVPVVDVEDKLWGLQFIDGDGRKTFLTGMRKSGCFHRIPGSGPIAIAEGYATGASIRQAMGWEVWIAFDAGNLKNVAAAARQRNPADTILICGDDDIGTPGNPGRTKATEAAAAVGGKAIFPCLKRAA
jgi:putative DNA primase/helicase